MSKISVDYYGPNGEPVSEELLIPVVAGCRKALFGLGVLGNAVEAFRVTWVYRNGNLPVVPRFKIHFSDPMGTPCSHAFTYRTTTGNDSVISAEEIRIAICEGRFGCLSYFITAHLKQCQEKIDAAQTKLYATLKK
ncbi:MAG: hypothetical protein Q8P17_00725 [bacterium]|nr:hypothetical protein [bacterium]